MYLRICATYAHVLSALRLEVYIFTFKSHPHVPSLAWIKPTLYTPGLYSSIPLFRDRAPSEASEASEAAAAASTLIVDPRTAEIIIPASTIFCSTTTENIFCEEICRLCACLKRRYHSKSSFRNPSRKPLDFGKAELFLRTFIDGSLRAWKSVSFIQDWNL